MEESIDSQRLSHQRISSREMRYMRIEKFRKCLSIMSQVNYGRSSALSLSSIAEVHIYLVDAQIST